MEGIVAALKGLVDSCVEELKVLQTIMLLASSTEHIKGKIVSQVSGWVGECVSGWVSE